MFKNIRLLSHVLLYLFCGFGHDIIAGPRGSSNLNKLLFYRLGEKCEAYRNRNKGFDVLSFDGGGTKGVMEAVIAKDIMSMATLLIRNPDKIKDVCIKILKENPDEDDQPNDLKKIAELLKGVESPVHPIEVFDMIVGTSTGKIKRIKTESSVNDYQNL